MLDANQLLWTKIAAGISLLLFAGFSWSVFRLRSRLLAANGWTVVDGAIIESRIDQPAEHFSDELSDASPIVRFRYQVGGRDFEGGKIDIGGSPTTTRVLATKKIAKYPVGLHVDVYVDPSDPASAVLEPRQSGNFVAVLTLAAIFGIAAIFLVVQSISERVAYTANGVPLFAFALPVVAIAVAVLAIVSFFQSRQLARASLAWPTTSGAIVQSEVMEERIEDPDNDNKSVRRLISRYQLDLRYRYRVGTRDLYRPCRQLGVGAGIRLA